MRRRAPAALAASLALVAPGPARAHHPEAPAVDFVGRSSVGLATEIGFLDQDGRSSRYVTQALMGEQVLAERLRLSVRLPLHAVQGAGTRSVVGLGDVAASAGVALVAREAIDVVVGMTFELPTGDEGSGLGDGHVLVHPFVSTGASWERLHLRIRAGDAIGLGPHHEHAAGAGGDPHVTLDPHSSHEVVLQLVVAIEAAPSVAIGLWTGGSIVLAREGRGDVPLWLGPNVTWSPADRVRMTVAGSVPVAEPHRFDAKLLLSSALLF